MATQLSDILRLLKILYQYQTVERAYPTPYSKRLENDVEHSYVLAMLAWFIIEQERLPLDSAKVLKYCLAHDLVEVYAGDTWTVGTKGRHLSTATKQKREDKAQERLRKTLPSFKGMHQYIEGYKKKNDPESRFVYALDKVISNLVVSLHSDKGKRVFKKLGVTLAMLNEHKKGKVNIHPSTDALWKSLNKLMADHDKKYKIFPVVTSSKKSSHRKRK